MWHIVTQNADRFAALALHFCHIDTFGFLSPRRAQGWITSWNQYEAKLQNIQLLPGMATFTEIWIWWPFINAESPGNFFMGICMHMLFTFCLQHKRVTLFLGPIYSCGCATSTCLYVFVPHAVSVNEPSWFSLLGTQIFCYLLDFVLMNFESSISLFVAFFGIVCYQTALAFQTCCKFFCKFWLPPSLLFPSRCVQGRGQGPHQGTNDIFVQHEYTGLQWSA